VGIAPPGATVEVNAAQDFSARALDKDGKEIPAGIEWTWSLGPASLGSLQPGVGSNRTTFNAGAVAGQGNLTVQARQGARSAVAVVPLQVVPRPGPGIPPSIEMTSPTEGATVREVVPVRVTASSNTVKVEIRVDGAEKATLLTAPFDWGWDTRLHADGTHVLRAIAYNSTGGSASDEATVTVANGKKPERLPGTPPWFPTLLAVFLFAVIFTAGFLAYSGYRRRRRREERQRQREYLR
jgi:hypothetical protein